MTRIDIAIAAAMISAAALIPTLAQAQASEPAAFQALHPDRDVLNGGQLTPAGRAGLEQFDGASAAYGAQYPASNVPAVHPRRRHQRQ